MNEQTLAAFKVWQSKYNQCLVTNWTVTDKKDSFENFCWQRYTGRLDFTLR